MRDTLELWRKPAAKAGVESDEMAAIRAGIRANIDKYSVASYQSKEAVQTHEQEQVGDMDNILCA